MAIDRAKLKEFVNRAVPDLGAGMSAVLVLLGDRLCFEAPPVRG